MKIDLNDICLHCSAFPRLCKGCQENELCSCQDKKFIEYDSHWDQKLMQFLKDVEKFEFVTFWKWENVIHQKPIPELKFSAPFGDSGIYTISQGSIQATAIDKSDYTLQELL